MQCSACIHSCLRTVLQLLHQSRKSQRKKRRRRRVKRIERRITLCLHVNTAWAFGNQMKCKTPCCLLSKSINSTNVARAILSAPVMWWQCRPRHITRDVRIMGNKSRHFDENLIIYIRAFITIAAAPKLTSLDSFVA